MAVALLPIGGLALLVAYAMLNRVGDIPGPPPPVVVRPAVDASRAAKPVQADSSEMPVSDPPPATHANPPTTVPSHAPAPAPAPSATANLGF